MKTFSTKTSIQATPEAVRRILTDASAYPTWDPTYSRIDGRIALGEKITLHHASLDPPMLSMTVSVFEPHQRMVWTGGGMPETVFKGERIFTLSSPDAGIVEFSMQLVFSGLMAPFLTRTIPDLQPEVDQFASALKKRAEA